MTNYEKYKEEIMEFVKDNSTTSKTICSKFTIPNILKPMGRNCTRTNCDFCNQLFSIWLMDEYKEPEVDWSKVPLDTKIYVRDYESDSWIPSHFAKYDDGRVYAWATGGTSWSCEGSGMIGWEYAKLADT